MAMNYTQYEPFFNSTWYPLATLRDNYQFTIAKNKIETYEIMDNNYHVRIDGMYEIDINSAITDSTLFKVNYSTGTVYFNSSLEGNTKNISYMALAKYSYDSKDILLDLSTSYSSQNVSDFVKEISNRVNSITAGTGNANQEVDDAHVDYKGNIQTNLRSAMNANYQYLDNKIGNLTDNGIAEPDLSTAIKNNRTQLADIPNQIQIAVKPKANQVDLDAINAEVSLKVNKDEVTNVLNPKGAVLYSSLPTSGNTKGDYYYCSDGDGTHGAGNYAWNGTAWYFSGTSDNGYNFLRNDLKNYNFDNKIKSATFTSGYYRKFDTGALVANGSWCYSGNIIVTPGMKFKTDVSNMHVCFLDSSSNYKSGTVCNYNTYGNSFTIPDGCAFICVSMAIAEKSKQLYYDFENRISSIENDVNKLSSKNKLFNASYTNGYYVHYSTGEVIASSNYSYTNIEASPNTKYTTKLSAHVCFNDANDALISGVLTNQTSGGVTYSGEFITPTNCTNMTISILTCDMSTAELYEASASTGSVVVDINGNGDYTSIVDAVANESENTVIYIKPGEYVGTIQAFEKRVILIGTDRNSCIVKTNSGSYSLPPINASCGYFENLTFYAEYINGVSSEVAITADTASYAFHCENEYGVGKTLELHHCILKSDFFAALGIGVRKDFTLILDDCELINNQLTTRGPNYSAYGSDGKGLGALFLHDSVGVQGNSYVKVKDCIFKSTLGYAMCLYDSRGGDNRVYCEFINNTLYDIVSGLDNNLFERENPFGSGIFILNGISHGNTNARLNTV